MAVVEPKLSGLIFSRPLFRRDASAGAVTQVASGRHFVLVAGGTYSALGHHSGRRQSWSGFVDAVFPVAVGVVANLLMGGSSQVARMESILRQVSCYKAELRGTRVTHACYRGKHLCDRRASELRRET